MKTKKIISKVLSLILAFIFFFSFPLNVFAKNANKEEIIYISTDLDGSVKGTYVVNSFDLDKDASILDYGKYDSVTNLTNENEIKVKDDEISVDGSKGKFFYQGDNPGKELPWIIDIKYYHEGKELKVNEIAGKEGKIEIKGHIYPNKKANPIYSEYYLGQLSMNIDSKKAVVTESEGATLAYQGSIQILNYTVLPKKELKFNIVTNATSFEMEPFSFSAIPFNMDFDLPDMGKFTGEISQLENAIAMLGDGTTRLNQGVFSLKDNANLLFDSLGSINSGIRQFADGQRELADGSKQFENGLKQYSVGIDKLTSELSQLSGGMNDLKSGLNQLKNGNDELKDGMLEYTKGIEEYTDGISQIYEGHLQFTDGIKKMGSESKQLVDAGDQLVDGSKQILEGLSIIDKINLSDKITLEDLKKLEPIVDQIVKFWDDVKKEIEELTSEDVLVALTTAKGILENSISNIEKIQKELDVDNILSNIGIQDPENPDVVKIIEYIKKVNDNLTQVKQELDRVLKFIELYTNNEENLEKLVEYIEQYNKEINEKLKPLKDALDNYNPEDAYDAIVKISNFGKQYEQFHNGLIQYTNGTKELVNGINNQLLPGSEKFDQGLGALSKNGSTIVNGANRISEGMIEVSKGLSLIVSKLDFDGDMSQVSKLKYGMDALVGNYSKISNGQLELANGADALADGLSEYRNGFGMFSNGVGQFAEGVDELSQGANTLKNETQGMTKLMEEQIDEAMSAFKKEGFKLESFVSEKNTNIQLVQFVYISDSITVVKEDEAPIETEELTFWQKIWDIITFWD